MCYYKLDYYDVSLEILAVYLQVRFKHGAELDAGAGGAELHRLRVMSNTLPLFRPFRPIRTVPSLSTSRHAITSGFTTAVPRRPSSR
mmetsp:Transcript_106828/g.309977  ORF Transcript_106828/g.309977 Transcript_106828/m.309977 type:complete len:87 (-) Transcript_106828:1245-1505(-)